MRPVLHGDVTAAARAMLVVPETERAGLLAALLAEAEAADTHRLETGRAHPKFGTGSLMSAALTRPVAREPYLDDPVYAGCLAQVFEALVLRAGGKVRRCAGCGRGI